MSPNVFAFKESLRLCFISGVASSQNLLYIGGIIPDVMMIIAFRFLFYLGVGHPEIVKLFPSGFAKVQQILSRNAIIIAVANPICTGVPKIRESDLRTSSFIWSISSCIEHLAKGSFVWLPLQARQFLQNLMSCSIKFIFLILQFGSLDLAPSIALSTRMSVALPFLGLPTTVRRFVMFLPNSVLGFKFASGNNLSRDRFF